MIFGGILAGGTGSRMNISDMPKQFLALGDKPIIIHTLEKFLVCPDIDHIYIGVHENWLLHMEDLIEKYIKIKRESIHVVAGGSDRNSTIMNIVLAIEKDFGESEDNYIITHDSVRPFITARILNDNVNAVLRHKACDTVVSAVDTIVVSEDGNIISEIPDRKKMYQGQTPQSFQIKLLKELYADLSEEEKSILTDACKICVVRQTPVYLVEGETSNLKITTVSDYKIAQAMVGDRILISYTYQLVSPQVFSVKYNDIDIENKLLIRPRYMAICHADQRYYLGKRDRKILNKKLPMALIHECAGEVLYDPTGRFSVGELVVPIPNVPSECLPEDIYENYGAGAHFLSSGYDGFMREYIDMPSDRVVLADGIPPKLAVITEFVSVAVHAVSRFMRTAHSTRKRIGIWGDGSMAYCVATVLKAFLPGSEIVVFGKHPRKLTYFSFVSQTLLTDDIETDFMVDHAFECCGGDGSYYAIRDIIRHVRPQGNVMLMGVSENEIAINTRDILEKGLSFIGCSRSGKEDFENAIALMKKAGVPRRLEAIIYEDDEVNSIEDIYRVFRTDLNTAFKTVFEWGV